MKCTTNTNEVHNKYKCANVEITTNSRKLKIALGLRPRAISGASGCCTNERFPEEKYGVFSLYYV